MTILWQILSVKNQHISCSGRGQIRGQGEAYEGFGRQGPIGRAGWWWVGPGGAVVVDGFSPKLQTNGHVP
jgi:hypothetical protein